MAKEYAIYPFKYMNITQRHDQGNHVPHWKGVTNWSDKPWDDALKDGGESYFEPKNDWKIIQILGLNNSTTNTIILRTLKKLTMPYKGKTDYIYLTLTHTNESDLNKLKVGQIIKKGSKLANLREGTDGNATGNHFHITANIGKYYGFLKNNNGKWCFTYEKSLLPNEAFYLDKSHTKVISARNYVFKTPPKEEVKIYKKVSATAGVNMRDKATTSSKVILTIPHNAKVEILTQNAGSSNGYSWSKVKYNGKVGFAVKTWLK